MILSHEGTHSATSTCSNAKKKLKNCFFPLSIWGESCIEDALNSHNGALTLSASS